MNHQTDLSSCMPIAHLPVVILPEPAAAARAEYCLVEILSASLVDAAIPCASKDR